VNIPSIAGDEGEVQEFIARNLQNMRLKVDVWELKLSELKLHPGYSRVEQDYIGRPVVMGILNGHIDAIPPGLASAWKHGPWRKLFGRGASDIKGEFAALVMAVKRLPNEVISSVRHQLEDCVKQTAKKDAWTRKHQPSGMAWLVGRPGNRLRT